MSTDIQIATRAFEPTNIEQAVSLAKTLFASGLLPRAVNKPEAAFAIIVAGRELGLTAFQSLRGIHIIEGKPTLAADTMLALALQSDKCEYFQCLDTTAEVAMYETQRRGAPGPTRISFTMNQARAAGVTGKDNWRKYPDAMLRARCIAALARIVYPDVFMGVYETDEVQQEEPVRRASEVVADAKKRVAAAHPPIESAPIAKVSEPARTPSDAEHVERMVEAAHKALDARELAPGPAKAPEPEPPPAPGTELTTLADFLGAIEAAVSFGVLQMIAKRASKVDLAKDDAAEVRAAWSAKRDALKAKVAA